jgi:hypothetical protein
VRSAPTGAGAGRAGGRARAPAALLPKSVEKAHRPVSAFHARVPDLERVGIAAEVRVRLLGVQAVQLVVAVGPAEGDRGRGGHRRLEGAPGGDGGGDGLPQRGQVRAVLVEAAADLASIFGGRPVAGDEMA